jgi:hypothetical protein
MPRLLLPALLVILACGGEPKPLDETDPAVIAAKAAAKTIAVSAPEGTTIQLALRDPISSAADKMGANVLAVVIGDVRDAAGRVVVPPGSTVTLRIDEISGVTSVQAKGLIRLSPVSVQIERQDIPLKAQIDSVPTLLVDRMLLVERAAQFTMRLTSGLAVNIVPSPKS